MIEQTADKSISVTRAVLSGLCASLVGIGLARFAYTPLIPALINAGWFRPSQATYLGAANFAGYLAGALFGRQLRQFAAPRTVLRTMMVLACATFFACAYSLPFLWFLVWRFASGLAGGVLMVLAALTVLPHVPRHRRGLAGGIVFTGVSLGIVISGIFVPQLLNIGLGAAWNTLGMLAIVLTGLAWHGWPPGAAAVKPEQVRAGTGSHRYPALRWLYLQYGLNAFALVPHMVFLVDFIARGLGHGLEAGAWHWVLFGLGAMVGPMLAGYAADHMGFVPASRSAMVLQVLAVALPAATVHSGWLMFSSVAAGAFTLGIVNLALGRIRELVPNNEPMQQAAWGYATSSFALGQAGGAYSLSIVFARRGTYQSLFAVSATVSLLALVIDLVMIGAARGSWGRRGARP